MKSKEFLRKTHRLVALGLVLGLLCMTCACGAADNGKAGGSMADDNRTQQDIGTTPGVNGNTTRDTNDRTDNTGNTSGITDMGGADGTDNVSIVDDVGDTIGDIVDDTADGVSNVTDDLVGNR